MNFENEIVINMQSKSQNEGFARMAVSAFISVLNPNMDELTDIKTAVSEAVTNAIIHGYEKQEGIIQMRLVLIENELMVEISDNGLGIDDVESAMQPLYTSKPDMERSGMGFTVMESFMDRVEVVSNKGLGTKVTMYKTISRL